MSFQWQKLEDAAASLEVDAQTLRKWIDEGRAPTRNTDGVTEVLIEFPEETADTADEPTVVDAEIHGPDDPAAPESPEHHALQVVSRRELQLAGTVAAAWQRLAEQAEREVARSRRLGTLGWCLVAALALGAGLGVYFATRATADAEKTAALTQQQLESTEKTRDDLITDKSALTGTIDKLTADLTDAKAQLAAGAERTKQQADVATALRATIDEQSKQLTDLRKQLDELRKQLNTERDQNKSLNKQLDAANKQTQQTRKQIDDLKKQLADATKPAEKPTENKK
ncbi:hypothetical protein HED60_02370 [Planctomycetales bacterium ZRK34]|nr:hypothetical protein HED60_02370 [Planctomycetales bacterium ZRK34]